MTNKKKQSSITSKLFRFTAWRVEKVVKTGRGGGAAGFMAELVLNIYHVASFKASSSSPRNNNIMKQKAKKNSV